MLKQATAIYTCKEKFELNIRIYLSSVVSYTLCWIFVAGR